MEGFHRQVYRQICVIFQAIEIGGYDNLEAGVLSDVTERLLDGVALLIVQVEGEIRLVYLNPFCSLLLQGFEKFDVNWENLIEQIKAMETILHSRDILLLFS